MVAKGAFASTLGVALAACALVCRAEPGVEFGDDSSAWAYDGECDDPRFQGDGMSDVLLDEDLGHDATDCRLLFNQGRIALGRAERVAPVGGAESSGIDFGDDSSVWANDGECDDPRFEGLGVAETLLEKDRYHDATDCTDLYNLGRVSLREAVRVVAATGVSVDEIDFGDNTSAWASDGECDDPRFEGPGVADVLVEEDVMRDAKDCRTLFERGRIALSPSYVPPVVLTPGSEVVGRLEAGDATLDSGEYADTFVFEGRAREHVTIDLRSDEFDPYLIVRAPSGQQFENDDHEGDTTWSLLSFVLPESGRYLVRVTTYEPGDAGSYAIGIRALAAQLR